MILDRNLAREVEKIFRAMVFINEGNLILEDRKIGIHFCKGSIFLHSLKAWVKSEQYETFEEFYEAYREVILNESHD